MKKLLLFLALAIPCAAQVANPPCTTGSWTPVDSSGGALTFTGVSAFYTKCQNLVFAYVVLTYPSTADTNGATIGGLPFTVANNLYNYSVSALSISAGTTVLVAQVRANTTTFWLASAAGNTHVLNSAVSGGQIISTVIYSTQ